MQNVVANTPRQSGKQFINELVSGMTVDSYFILEGKEARFSKDSNLYVVLRLKDRTGSIVGVMFDPPSLSSLPDTDSPVRIKGVVDGYRNGKRIKVTSLSVVDEWRSTDFIARSVRSIDEMSQEYGKLVCSLADKRFRALIKMVFAARGSYRSFCESPLAVSGYGACIGGAMEHTLNVARLVDEATVSYPELDRDILMTAVLLHEVGALDGFDITGHIHRSVRGSKVALEVLSGYRVRSAGQRIKLDDDVLSRIEGIILYAKGSLGEDAGDDEDAIVVSLCHAMDMTVGRYRERTKAKALVSDISIHQQAV